MKWKSLLIFIGLTLFLFQGCVPSLHPLYTEDVLSWSKEIAGVWQPEDTPDSKADSWVFAANKGKSYQLIQFDSEGRPGVFEVHLVKLGAHYFFDLSPRTANSEEREKYPQLAQNCLTEMESYHYQPVHTFAKVNFDANQMSIAMFDGEFLEDLLDKNRIRIKHEKVDGTYVLTASSKELQKFMTKYADDPKAFLEPTVLRKAG